MAPVFAALLVAVLLFNSVIMPRFVRHGSEVEVPNVMTLPLSEAVLRLQEVGLSVRDTLVNASPTVEAGRVMDQAPRPGTRLKPDRALRLVVSGGRREQRVPELAGVTLRSARLTVNEEGYELGDVIRVPSEKVARNFVVASDPPPHEIAARGERISLLVSDGPQKSLWVMPDLTGEEIQLTADKLNFAGFVAVIADEEQAWMLPRHRIRATLPRPGTRVAEGDTIRLYGR